MLVKEAQKLARNPELLDTFQRLVNAKLLQWHLEGAIEGIIGRDFDGMNSAVEDLCVCCDSGSTCTKADLVAYLRQLKEDS